MHEELSNEAGNGKNLLRQLTVTINHIDENFVRTLWMLAC